MAVSLIKSMDARRIVSIRECLSRYPNLGRYEPIPRIALRGAHAREYYGPSFARAFVAGLRQAGDTAPLIQQYN